MYELIVKKSINEVFDIKHSLKKIMTMRFLSSVIMLISNLSIVIGSTRIDIVALDRLIHVILLNWIK